MRFCARKKYVLPNGSTLFTCARSKGLLARFVSDTKHSAIYRWTFIDVAHENTSLVFRDTRRTMAIGRRIDDKSNPGVLWTTCWHHCISLSIRAISRIVQLYWFNFCPYFFVLEGWQDWNSFVSKRQRWWNTGRKTFERTMKLVCTNFFSNFQVGEFSIVFYFL